MTLRTTIGNDQPSLLVYKTKPIVKAFAFGICSFECYLSSREVRLANRLFRSAIDPELERQLAPYRKRSRSYWRRYRIPRVHETVLPIGYEHDPIVWYLTLELNDGCLFTQLLINEAHGTIEWRLFGPAERCAPALDPLLFNRSSALPNKSVSTESVYALFRLLESDLLFEARGSFWKPRKHSRECTIVNRSVRIKTNLNVLIDDDLKNEIEPYRFGSNCNYNYRFTDLLYANIPDMASHPEERIYLLVRLNDSWLLTLITIDPVVGWVCWYLLEKALPVEPALHAALRSLQSIPLQQTSPSLFKE